MRARAALAAVRAAVAVAALTLGVMAVQLAVPAHASCVFQPLEEQLSGAQSAFVGTVEGLADHGTVARVAVEEVWVGPDLRPTVLVRGGPEQPRGLVGLFTAVSSSGDVRFAVRDRYLLVTPAGYRPFHVDSCSGTQPFDDIVARLRPVDARRPVPPGLAGVAEPPGSPLPWLLAGVGVTVGAVAATVAVRWRRRGVR